MPNYKRYSVVGPWEVHEVDKYSRTDIADLRDKKDGKVYIDGAYRVVDIATNKTVGTFFGESAWCAAQRCKDDRFFALRRAEPAW
jgi:hypothetical protein